MALLLAAACYKQQTTVSEFVCHRISYLLLILITFLLCLITKNGFLISEKTTGPITVKFSGIILGAILRDLFVSECKNSKGKFSIYRLRA
jgi:hypothetical protein